MRQHTQPFEVLQIRVMLRACYPDTLDTNTEKTGLTNLLPGTAIERGSVIASTPPTSPARIILPQPSPLQDVTTAEEQGTDLPSPYLRDPAGHRPTHPAPRSSTPGVVQPNPQHTRHSPVNTVEEAEADDPNPQHTIRRNQEQVEGNETDEDVFFEQINSGFLETSSQSFDSTLPQAASSSREEWICRRDSTENHDFTPGTRDKAYAAGSPLDHPRSRERVYSSPQSVDYFLDIRPVYKPEHQDVSQGEPIDVAPTYPALIDSTQQAVTTAGELTQNRALHNTSEVCGLGRNSPFSHHHQPTVHYPALGNNIDLFATTTPLIDSPGHTDTQSQSQDKVGGDELEVCRLGRTSPFSHYHQPTNDYPAHTTSPEHTTAWDLPE